MHAESVMRYR